MMLEMWIAFACLSLLAGFGYVWLAHGQGHSVVLPQSSDQTNLEAFEAQSELLNEEKEKGLITEALYQQLHQELERKLLRDIPETQSSSLASSVVQARSLNRKILLWVICVSLSVLIYLFYFYTAQTWQRQQDARVFHEAVAVSVKSSQLAPSLTELPLSRLVPILQSYAHEDIYDPQRWLFLGRFFMALEQLELAEIALSRSFSVSPDLRVGLQVLKVKLALNDGVLDKTTDALLLRLSALAASDPRFDLMHAMILYRSGRYQAAIDLWTDLVSRSGQSLDASAAEGMQLIQGYLADAKAKLATLAQEKRQQDEVSNTQDSAQMAIEVTISEAKISAEGYLWVVAKPLSDAGPPLAVQKISMTQVRAALGDSIQGSRRYPLVLSKDHAMIPHLTINQHEDLLVKAMISSSPTLTGEEHSWVSTKQKGWQDQSSPVRLTFD